MKNEKYRIVKIEHNENMLPRTFKLPQRLVCSKFIHCSLLLDQSKKQMKERKKQKAMKKTASRKVKKANYAKFSWTPLG